MKTSKLLSTVMAVGLSTLLLVGEPWSTFSYYCLLCFNVIAWLALLTGGVKGEVAESIRDGIWISSASSVYQIYALVLSGHPVLGASSFLCSVLLVSFAFRKEAA